MCEVRGGALKLQADLWTAAVRWLQYSLRVSDFCSCAVSLQQVSGADQKKITCDTRTDSFGWRNIFCSIEKSRTSGRRACWVAPFVYRLFKTSQSSPLTYAEFTTMTMEKTWQKSGYGGIWFKFDSQHKWYDVETNSTRCSKLTNRV